MRELSLVPHPEGGFYAECFRSGLVVRPGDGRGERAALTAIHFLLPAGSRSRWHRLRSDETWAHLEGGALAQWTWREGEAAPARRVLGPGGLRQATVPAGTWQAAEPVDGFALLACVVGPGFALVDLEFAVPGSEAHRAIAEAAPELSRFLRAASPD